MSTKITSDMVKPFLGDGDVVAWLEKVTLVASLSGVKELEKFIPLFLEGSALSVYLEMGAEEKKSADKIISRLKEVYSDSSFVAHGKLMKLGWSGEPIEAYVTEIRRLVGLAGFETEVEKMVRLTFVNSLPDSVGVELQQINGIDAMPMPEIIKRARILTANIGSGGVNAGAVKQFRRSKEETEDNGGRGGGSSGRGGWGRGGGRGGGRSGEDTGFRGKCFTCGGPHMAKSCPEKKIKCYSCGREGHMSYNCESGNE